MKKILRGTGITLVICGIVLFFISGYVQKITEPKEVKSGYMSDGKFIQTDSGYIGGNEEGHEGSGQLKTISILLAVVGAVAVIGSCKVKEEHYGDQYRR